MSELRNWYAQVDEAWWKDRGVEPQGAAVDRWFSERGEVLSTGNCSRWGVDYLARGSVAVHKSSAGDYLRLRVAAIRVICAACGRITLRGSVAEHCRENVYRYGKMLDTHATRFHKRLNTILGTRSWVNSMSEGIAFVTSRNVSPSNATPSLRLSLRLLILHQVPHSAFFFFLFPISPISFGDMINKWW